jgi:hypothetical protein
MYSKRCHLIFTTLTIFFLSISASGWAKSETQPTSTAPSLISANGFACSDTGNQVSCNGIFKDLDKNMTLTIIGKGVLTLHAQKGDTLYSYSSGTGCLCEKSKKEINCLNAQAKGKKFKGEQMMQESAAYCAGK